MTAPPASFPKERPTPRQGALRRVVSLLAPHRTKVFLSLAAMAFTCLGLLALPLLAKAMLGAAIHLHKITLTPGIGLAVVASKAVGMRVQILFGGLIFSRVFFYRFVFVLSQAFTAIV